MTGRGTRRVRPAPLVLLAAGSLFAARSLFAAGWWVAPEGAQAAEPAPSKRLPALELSIDPADVDIAGGQLTARLSRPAAKLTLRVISLTGAVLAEAEQAFEAAPAGAPLVLRWTPPARDVARLEVYGYDTSGYYKGIAITPWSFEIPHQDVIFATDSAEIAPGEEKKLQASLALVKRELPRASHLGRVTLYILAHTDTVGTAAYNLKLSTRRARAIGSWFKAHGLRMPMAYDGVGEGMLKVETADEVAEPRNRRVDYMLGIEPPRYQKAKTVPAWKAL